MIAKKKINHMNVTTERRAVADPTTNVDFTDAFTNGFTRVILVAFHKHFLFFYI